MTKGAETAEAEAGVEGRRRRRRSQREDQGRAQLEDVIRSGFLFQDKYFTGTGISYAKFFSIFHPSQRFIFAFRSFLDLMIEIALFVM